MGYIYCIRNKTTDKCYIGETAKEDVAERWKQHVALIKRGKGCPALCDAVQKHGLDNFEFRVIIVCFDEDRFDFERHYIAKYNSQVPNGYNILPGGIGGAGFKGKKHTAETITRLAESGRRFREANPDWFERCREKWEQGMAKVDIGAAVKNSPVWQKAKAEGRIGGAAHKDSRQSEETKAKIRESVLKYFANNDANKVNIENHRSAMAKAVGVKVEQYDKSNNLIASYNSIAEAVRQSHIPKSTIQKYLKFGNTEQSQFIWKKAA